MQNPKIGSWLYWGSLMLAITMAYMLGRGDSYDEHILRLANPDTTAERVLNEVISSWIPDRSVSNEAGVIAEPFTYRFGFFPDTIIALAKMVHDSDGVPAPVAAAQWALESGFGKGNLGDHNYFGLTFAAVKDYMDRPDYVLAHDRILTAAGWKRVTVKFANFQSIRDCFVVYGNYLSDSRYYTAAFRKRTVKGFINVLAQHYAQDPEYATKLMAIIERYNLIERTR